MDCNDKNKRFLVYNTAWDKKCKKESNVNAECCVIVDDDNCENLYSKFEECIKKDITDDIVEIVRKIRGILNGNEEIKLKVQIRKGDYIQDVEYFDGVLYNCSFTTRNWNDLVSVSKNYRGTDIQYKKSGSLVPDNVYEEIGVFLSKIEELSNLEYGEKSKSKKKAK